MLAATQRKLGRLEARTASPKVTDMSNRFVVTANTQAGVVVVPVSPGIVQPQDALVLAAWLVKEAQPLTALPFADVLASVQGS